MAPGLTCKNPTSLLWWKIDINKGQFSQLCIFDFNKSTAFCGLTSYGASAHTFFLCRRIFIEMFSGHVKHHAYIPAHARNVFVPARPPVLSTVVIPTSTRRYNLYEDDRYRSHYGGFGVGVDYGGQGAGHGFQVALWALCTNWRTSCESECGSSHFSVVSQFWKQVSIEWICVNGSKINIVNGLKNQTSDSSFQFQSLVITWRQQICCV